MSAPITLFVDAELLPQGPAAQPDNMNTCMLVTTQLGPLSTALRFKEYTDAASVAADFGSASAAAQHANAFFGTKPNPTNVGGSLFIGYHRAASETVAASAGVLTGGQLDEASVVAALQAISDGSFDVTVDGGAATTITAQDFRTVLTLADVVTKLKTALTAVAVVTLSSDNRIVVTSKTTGALSAVTLFTADAVGTFVGQILKLAAGTGATVVAGAASSTLTAETIVQCLTALKALVNFKGCSIIDQPIDADRLLVAAWAQANDTLVYEVFSATTNLNVDVTNPVWEVKLAGQTYFRCLYSAAGNRQLATSYMARVHTVNFAAENAAITMQLKQLAVPAEDYDTTTLTDCQNVGLDVYAVTTKNTSVVITSGANDFVDNVYNLLAYIDAVQTDTYNLLGGTATKVPQTAAGVHQLVDQVEKTTRQFVRAGVFAPGTWTSTDFFGDLDTFNRNVEANGFYVLAGSLADQSAADRAARKSPPIQVAVKNAGAIHSADIIINFNR